MPEIDLIPASWRAQRKARRTLRGAAVAMAGLVIGIGAARIGLEVSTRNEQAAVQAIQATRRDGDREAARLSALQARHAELQRQEALIATLRDTLLQLAGQLTFDRPEGIQVAGSGGKGRHGITRGLLGIEEPYRTIYLPVVRDNIPELFSTFDFPGPTQIKGQRDVTTVAPQALFFMNNPFVEQIAAQITEKAGKDPKAIYQLLLGREPTSEEITDARDLDDQTLVQALLGTAEFRYVF